MWQGDYPDWKSAVDRCNRATMPPPSSERCRSALRAVLAGESSAERDSLFFDDLRLYLGTHCPPSTLRSDEKGPSGSLILAGALGSLYFQHRNWLSHISSLEWHVVEQPHFVECGKADAENDQLRFFSRYLNPPWRAGHPTSFFSQGTSRRFEAPTSWAKRFSSLGADFILLDRVPVTRRLRAGRIDHTNGSPQHLRSDLSLLVFPGGRHGHRLSGFPTGGTLSAHFTTITNG